MGTAKILIVDDDPHIREVVRFALEQAGFGTSEAKDGADGLQQASSGGFDLVVLDIMMPEMDGTEVCRRLRQKSNVPIVFMSSRDDEIDRILGLELGGDDYVAKPFSPRELVARVKAVLRRSGERKAPDAAKEATRTLKHGGLELDLDRYEARFKGKTIVLTATEFGIVRTLLGYPGKVFSRSELIDGAHGEEHFVSDRTVDSHMRRVRQKLGSIGADVIETIHGIGYKLRDE
ncbi:MAG: response regulator transcription factor [Deltaproteobacteria bacterium]|nr:response regulator transcription factor [Deltaproteobacteria bacterium]